MILLLVVFFAFIPYISCFNITCRCQQVDKNLIILPVTAPNDLLTDLHNIEKNVNRVCSAACLKHQKDREQPDDLKKPGHENGNLHSSAVKVGKISVYRSKREVFEPAQLPFNKQQEELIQK